MTYEYMYGFFISLSYQRSLLFLFPCLVGRVPLGGGGVEREFVTASLFFFSFSFRFFFVSVFFSPFAGQRDQQPLHRRE